MGVTVGDYDNDGYEEMFVTNWGSSILYHNNGNGTFTDVTAKAGVENPHFGTGAAGSITTATASSTFSWAIT